MNKNYLSCQNDPLLGAVMVDPDDNEAQILVNYNQVRANARHYLDDNGITSRKGREDNEFKNFVGNECPPGFCWEYKEGKGPPFWIIMIALPMPLTYLPSSIIATTHRLLRKQ